MRNLHSTFSGLTGGMKNRSTPKAKFQSDVRGPAGLLGLLAVTFLSALSPQAHAAIGRTAGSFTVAADGSANYSIPIWVTPGPQGLQPNIALVYNHRNGGGPLGIGWFLGGLSSITRCNKTLVEDGAAAPVTLTYNDAFCLDGRRLRLTSSDTLSTYGQDGTTYQTEIADFSNVTAHGAQGNGPSFFTVQGNNGLTYEYGNGANSQVRATDAATSAVSWHLDMVTDRYGNKMGISYLAPSSTLSGTTLPASISWTPTSHGASTYSYSMQFAYTTNLPQSSIAAYVAGTAVLNQDLMTSISIANSAGTTIKQYVFGYDTSPTTGGNRLTSVKECADGGASNCLIPTTISYQPGAKGVSNTASTFTFGSGTNKYFAGFDLNGDGFKDLVYQVGTTWYVAFGSSGGYGTASSTGITTSAYLPGQFMLPGDLRGSGKDGLLAKNGTDWWYYTWNGSSFTGVDTHLVYDTASADFALADTNGDGLPDLASVHSTINTSVIAYINLNTGAGTAVSFGAPNTAYTLSDTRIWSASLISPDAQEWGGVRSFDFNGDGLQDVALDVTITPAKGGTADQVYALQGNGPTFSSSLLYQSTDGAWPLFINWNNDACTDVVHATTLLISGCDGTARVNLTLGSRVVTVMDWDADGRTDLVYASGSTLSVQLSNGQGLGATVATSIPYNSTAAYAPLDADQDGLDELAVWNLSSLTYYLHSAANQRPDLLSSISDGYNNSSSPTYTSILWGSYSSSATATTYRKSMLSSRCPSSAKS
ncbi:MAG: FG-GAP-like repeat-containing protein [Steroidobacteraceae bacterium]